MVSVDGTVVNVALSALQAAFHTTGSTLQWIVEAYVLSLASLLLLGGSFGDLYGRKRIFLIGVVLFGVSSISCGFAQSFGVIIASRAIQGVGGALLVPGSLALISASFPEETRGRAIGIWSGTTAIAAMVGPVLGGWLVQNASWRWIFFLNVPIALMVILISSSKVPESRNSSATRPDWIGACLAAIGLGLCTFALIESTYRSSTLLIIGGTGLLSLCGFVFWESRTDQPMMPLVLFCSKSFSIANVITLFIYAALTGTLYYLPLQLIQVQHYSATKAGATLLPISILISILSRYTGVVVARFGPRLPLVVEPSYLRLAMLYCCVSILRESIWVLCFRVSVYWGWVWRCWLRRSLLQ
ncbi:MAG TPA: DHA2 family efflux MFS transporter permease subunit [Acidisarcina sp.]